VSVEVTMEEMVGVLVRVGVRVNALVAVTERVTVADAVTVGSVPVGVIDGVDGMGV
jgi:hypothetical protein